MGLLDQLVAEIAASQRAGVGAPQLGFRDVPSGTPSLPYYTGPGGLFGVSGLERDIISSRVQPMGLADRLPAVPTNRVAPLFPYLTGFLEETGSEKNGVCDDPPTAGPGKSCIQTAQFGRYERQTRVFELNRVGDEIDRGEFLDLRFFNDPLLNSGNSNTVPGVPGTGDIRNESLMRMIELGVAFQLLLSRQVYEGNPANNTAGGGYSEFPGLDILIGTDKVDAITGTQCPSLDSLIQNANYTRVDGATGGGYYVEKLTYMLRSLQWNAEQMNFGATTWALVMRPGLFYELTSIWPCAYNTYRCNTLGENNGGYVDAAAMRRQVDDMRSGRYLLVDGNRYNVIFDTAIREETNTTGPANVVSGCFASDIYIIPLTVRGGVPVTYWQHKDFRQAMRLGLDSMRLPGNFFWTDNGKFMWHAKPPNNWCLQWLAKIEPRIILRTPQLAGRLQNLLYCPLIHERDAYPDDSYFANGGVSGVRAGPSLYSDWNMP